SSLLKVTGPVAQIQGPGIGRYLDLTHARFQLLDIQSSPPGCGLPSWIPGIRPNQETGFAGVKCRPAVGQRRLFDVKAPRERSLPLEARQTRRSVGPKDTGRLVSCFTFISPVEGIQWPPVWCCSRQIEEIEGWQRRVSMECAHAI